MSVNVLLGLLGPDEVAKYSDGELDALSQVLVHEISEDPAIVRRLMEAIDRIRAGLRASDLAAAAQG